MMTKKFDCVEMKRRGAEQVRLRLAGMTLEQEIEYWRQRSGQFRQDQERLRAATKGKRPSASVRK